MVDVGCGESTPYRALFDHRVYVGVDQFEYAGVQGNAESLPVASERADLVLCTEVLEHLPNPECALAEMYRVLTSDGFLVVTVPLIWGEHSYVDYQRWTESGLRMMLRSVGFQVLAVRRRGGVFGMLGSMVTQVPHQVFGRLDEQPNWLLKVLYVCSWLFTVPIPWILASLDGLDRDKAFTVGYSVLCQKRQALESF
jgi:SAM-dependent methyltransferase